MGPFSITVAGGENVPDSANGVANRSSIQANFYTGGGAKGSISPETYKPFGTVSLRGQAMLKYEKVYGSSLT
jgi:hypothetical protein